MKKQLNIPLIILFIVCLTCILGPVFSGYSPFTQQIEYRNEAPSFAHLLGTDSLGRDIFTRVCIGGRTSLFIAFICTVVTLVIGSVYGGLAALVEKLDRPLLMCLDILVSIPDILMILTLSLWINCNTALSICCVICVLGWVKMAKLTRDLLKPMRNAEYIVQSRLVGKGELFIVIHHLIPNIFPHVISRAILSFASFMFYESFISYLGIGLQPPNASWGTLLSNAQIDFSAYPYQCVSYSLFLFVTLLSTNCLGESIQNLFLNTYENIEESNNDIGVEPKANRPIDFKDLVDAQASPPLLSVNNLSVRYENRQVLKGVSFSLQKGEIIGIIGQSGCGKTTLSRVLTGTAGFYGAVIDKDSEIYFRGRKVHLPHDDHSIYLTAKDGIAIIPQDPFASFDPTMRIGRQMFECISLAEKEKSTCNDKQRIAIRYLELVGVDNPQLRLTQFPNQLSGGIAQRIMIAMALLTKPELLLCDEPTAALDAINQNRIILLLKKIVKDHNISVLFISHDMNAVKKISNRILHMHNGRLTEMMSQFPRQKSSLPGKQSKLMESTKEAEYIFKIKNLQAGYSERVWTLNNVSFDIRAKEVLGILGESGSGKTTLVRALIKSLAIPQFPVTISPSSSITAHDVTRIQYIVQNPICSLDPHWRIEQTLMENGCLTRNSMLEWMEKIGLSSKVLSSRPSQLSIGQCQRIAIARALSYNPELLICDEPTSSMDPQNQELVLSLLNQLTTSNNVTTLFISHDIDIILRFADHIIVMFKGNMLEWGPISVFGKKESQPHHPYTEALLNGVVFNELTSNTPQPAMDGCVFYPYCKQRTVFCANHIPKLEEKHSNCNNAERAHFIACFQVSAIKDSS